MKKTVFIVLSTLFIILFAGCPPPAETISGTITYIGSGFDMSGIDGILGIDDDTQYDGGTPPVKTFTLTWGSGNTLDYEVDITDVPAGQYYVYFFIEGNMQYAYGYYNGDALDAYGQRVLVTVEDGVVINVEIDVS